jgi:hypothetical protein
MGSQRFAVIAKFWFTKQDVLSRAGINEQQILGLLGDQFIETGTSDLIRRAPRLGTLGNEPDDARRFREEVESSLDKEVRFCWDGMVTWMERCLRVAQNFVSEFTVKIYQRMSFWVNVCSISRLF